MAASYGSRAAGLSANCYSICNCRLLIDNRTVFHAGRDYNKYFEPHRLCTRPRNQLTNSRDHPFGDCWSRAVNASNSADAWSKRATEKNLWVIPIASIMLCSSLKIRLVFCTCTCDVAWFAFRFRSLDGLLINSFRDSRHRVFVTVDNFTDGYHTYDPCGIGYDNTDARYEWRTRFQAILFIARARGVETDDNRSTTVHAFKNRLNVHVPGKRVNSKQNHSVTIEDQQIPVKGSYN